MDALRAGGALRVGGSLRAAGALRAVRLTLLLVCAALAACREEDPRPTPPLLLVVVVDLSGPHATDGAQIRNGARLALLQARATTSPEAGSSPGPLLRLVVFDDRGDPARASALGRRLAGVPEVLAAIGPADVAAARAAIPAYEAGRSGLPLLIPTVPGADPRGDGRWSFRMGPGAGYIGETLAWFLVTELGIDSAATFVGQGPLGEAVALGFAAEVRRLGGGTREPVLLSSGAPDRRIREAAHVAPAIVLAGPARITGPARAVLRRAGIEAPILLSDVPDVAGPLDGEQAGVFYPLVFDPVGQRRARAFADSYERVFGTPPQAPAALAYDAARLVLRAVRSGAMDRDSLRRWLRDASRQGAFHGATGNFFFTREGEVVRDLTIAAAGGGRTVRHGPVVRRRRRFVGGPARRGSS
ncbi:MAG: ABC transporter substrate-binding protein [Gemmatimonadetes bacterium]|nr:ABC transporter substrate-binding protein [Gemmatimonadota bacterium]